MLPDRVSNPGPLTYESGALPIALRGPAWPDLIPCCCKHFQSELMYQGRSPLYEKSARSTSYTKGNNCDFLFASREREDFIK